MYPLPAAPLDTATRLSAWPYAPSPQPVQRTWKVQALLQRNPQHGYSLPRLDEGILSEPKTTTYEARSHGKQLGSLGRNSGACLFQLRIIMPARRFPPPWSLEELNDACFVVTDSAGQNLFRGMSPAGAPQPS